jgi:predicted transcriptional regulator
MEVSKTIIMDKEMADRIQKLADQEQRSFSRQALVLLEAAVERRQGRSPGPGLEAGDGGKPAA